MLRRPTCPKRGSSLGIWRAAFNYWALGPNGLPTSQTETDYCRHCLSVWDVSFRKRSLIVLTGLALVFAASLYAYVQETCLVFLCWSRR
jgi:hypothetical protein